MRSYFFNKNGRTCASTANISSHYAGELSRQTSGFSREIEIWRILL